ncbi:PHD finger protein 3 isoform X2 [Numida meleagris]|nr:PHD finger protein 3 isoform X2 [Numida meleagris]XP_021248314.1 PHD finger protein 3 isoform X2 [Numida meleagris]XP_021248315.1 PHD finger protein 3 isoform X2 [Numida meleagris]XP_021248316.1 PHD finger protein 3 isoform X2 [Numida meleagris]XP_021248317.1 PHD finger protein 3 isoform X2 [Numida meleagris]XP_021248318.1 PHD finger protein 3 isoform X2 [Numida meleagris]XP_021248319.1 PHD finger protein 3 isoform X2 [Numida meleagris]XP_021248320.1 PHD finger protein 3 isoform X2 [Numid
MDEEGVKESGNDAVDEDELTIPNRNLRSRLEETSVASPRKSPRLMAQEPVRSLRQSTLAKRSNIAPVVSTKKSSVKSGSAPKTGQKQQEKSLAKEADVATPLKIEQPKEVRRSTRRSGQTEGTVAASQSNTKCIPGPEEVNETKSEPLEEAKVEETSEELSSNSAGACTLPKETKEISEIATKTESGNVDSVCSASADTEITAVNDEANDVNDSMGSEASSEEKSESKTDKLETITEEQSGITGKTNDLSSVCVNQSEISETFSNLSGSVEDGVECRLASCVVEIPYENTLSVKECITEPVDDGKGLEKTVTSSEKLLDSTEFDNKDLKSEEFTSVDQGNSISESAVLDHTSQNVQQQINSTTGEDSDTLKFQVDDKQINIPSKCEKNAKPRHSKSVVENSQNMTVGTEQKSGTTQQDVRHSRTRADFTVSSLHSSSSASLKRNADEQESHQHPNNPVKIRKKQTDLSLKTKGRLTAATVKKQANTMLKKIPRVQTSGLVHKSSIQRATEKSTQSGFKDIHHSGHPVPGHISNLGQKQAQKYQLASVLKTNSSTKEEVEAKDAPMAEHLKEDDKEKNKSKRVDKNLQPRQRRSSKSLSLDEPPLFIPDNISTVKREGLEHTPASESKHVWVPNKQCGFCKKPHGNRFMVGCGRCDDWFHGDCVGLSLSQAQQMGEEDKEYVCVKCCAEEDKKAECLDQSVLDAQVKIESHKEEKTIEYEKPGMSKQGPTCHLNLTAEKGKQTEDTGKHKVKIFKRESGDGKNLSESRDSDTKKGQHVPARKASQTAVIPRRSSEEKSEKNSKESLSVVEKSTKSGAHEKQEIKKKKNEKGPISATHLPAVPASKPSADQIRHSVKQSLKEILMKRLTDSSLKIPEERAAKVATRIERELFSFFRDTDSKYKNKYRSLMFNLKDPKNNILFKKVLKGEVTPDHLIKMSPEELASKELAAWRQRENRHTIEMIEKEQREVERRPITKITHKGEIEIESETPMKEQEVMEIQEPNMMKLHEKSEEAEKDKEGNESASPDTTSQHKNHLFDLNCKICIGRMAPPTDDDLSSKKVKVSVGVARKQSDNEAESIADALSSTSCILASELLEDDKQDSSKSSFPTLPKSETPGTVECESLFLARLNFIWKGFINMPSVAKFVIKAYPVSGSFEYLTEDLPDSIQVGGRISPHTVWEYVEKIKASGTKEICVVRFTPVTEEDQISYALLFAYFSSRKRYGVAANNMKQVKDLYLIPLGSSDKVPHHLVPFDGPGIEIHRPNLLLGLIIRQKMKRQISAVTSVTSSFVDEVSESTLSSVPPEKKSKPSKPEVSHNELALEEEEENDFFNSFTTVLHKQRNKPQQSNIEDVPAVIEPLVESTKHEPPKPLRFLPGVLVGWENQPSTLELANKPLPVDDILQSLLGTTGQVSEQSKPETSPGEDIPLLNEQATLKEENMDVDKVTVEVSETKAGSDDTQDSTNATVVPADAAVVGSSSSTRNAGTLIGLSLKGKPPDVSTEAFLANLSTQSQNKETEESKENDSKQQPPDQDNVTQETRRTTNSSFSSSSNAGKSNESNASVSSAEGTTANTSKSPFINPKRDPRQAAGRNQQTNASENREGDVTKNEDRQNVSGNDQVEPENKQSSGEVGLNLYPSDAQTNEMQYSSTATKADNACASQAEDTKQSQEDAMQNIETLNSFRRGPAATSSHFETENSSCSEFISKVPSPITTGSFSSVRPPQQNFQHPKSNPPGFQFQAPAPHNFPPQNSPMFGFPPHLPPQLLPPPGFGFPQNPMMPWPPVGPLSGQPPPYAGPIAQGLPVAHKQSRFVGPENFFQSKDSRRPERRHSDPWGRQEQHVERGFSRGKNDQQRQRFYSDSHHQKKDRHEKEWNNEKYWEQDSERNRRRDRNQEKERERKSREEGHRDKERLRLPHGDRGADGKSPRETRNPEKKTEKPKPEEQAQEKDKEREKSKEKHRERESEKNRDRHRDHSDRTKSKR